MNVRKHILSFIFTSSAYVSIVFSQQWTNIAQPGNMVFMTSDYNGFRVKNILYSPSSGSGWWIYSTGNDWQTETLVESAGAGGAGCCNISQIFFLNDSVGFYSKNDKGYYSFWKTNDFGYNWSQMCQVTFACVNMFFTNDSLGYIAGLGYGPLPYKPRFCKIINGIPSGNLITSYEYDFTNARVYFVSDSTGFVLCKDTNNISKLLQTSDYGNNWITVLSDSTNQFTAIKFPSDSIGYLTCKNGVVYKSTDTGNSWNQLSFPASYSLNDVDFINDTSGFVVSDNGGIYKTLDGGMTWITENSGTNDNLIDINIFSGNIAYAVTSTGYLLKNFWAFGIGGSNNSLSEILIYPNPSNGIYSMEISQDLLKSQMYIYNVLGKEIFQTTLSKKFTTIDIPNLTQGVYVVKLQTPDGKSLHQSIVQQ